LITTFEWKSFVKSQKGISKDKLLRAKLFEKISAPYQAWTDKN
tara:strand:- start:640 stop:768 length:129 start_codon:yes stop_codon:yes gene_type:complete